MNFTDIPRRLATPALSIVVSIAVTTAVVAQDIELTPEEQAKLHKLTAFLKKADEFLPTVNRIDHSELPVTFPFETVLDHVVVDEHGARVGDVDRGPYQGSAGNGQPTI